MILCNAVETGTGKVGIEICVRQVQLQNLSTGVIEQNDRDCEDPMEVSGPTLCLEKGQIGQVLQGLFQLSSAYPCDSVFYNLPCLFFQLFPTFIMKKNHGMIKSVG